MTLSALALSAASWTAEHISPWAIDHGKGWIKGWRRSTRDKQAEIQIARMADAMLPQDAFNFRLVCVPSTKNGFRRQGDEGGKLSIRFEFISTASVAIKPTEMKGSVFVHGGSVQVKESIPYERKLSADFLKTGGIHKQEFEFDIVWNKPEASPKPGSVLLLTTAGELQMLAPWRQEYRTAKFTDSVYLPVTGNP